MNASINNTQELKSCLEQIRADKDYYSIYPDENFYFDTVCYISLKNKTWEIGTFERGIYHHVKHFKTEAEACQAFLEEFYPEVLNGEK